MKDQRSNFAKDADRAMNESARHTQRELAEGGGVDMVALYIGDGYLAGASTHNRANDIDFWRHLTSDGHEWELAELNRVPPELAQQLEDQGTSDQYFSDGYDAANAAADYAGELIDSSQDYTEACDADGTKRKKKKPVTETIQEMGSYSYEVERSMASGGSPGPTTYVAIISKNGKRIGFMGVQGSGLQDNQRWAGLYKSPEAAERGAQEWINMHESVTEQTIQERRMDDDEILAMIDRGKKLIGPTSGDLMALSVKLSRDYAGYSPTVNRKERDAIQVELERRGPFDQHDIGEERTWEEFVVVVPDLNGIDYYKQNKRDMQWKYNVTNVIQDGPDANFIFLDAKDAKKFKSLMKRRKLNPGQSVIGRTGMTEQPAKVTRITGAHELQEGDQVRDDHGQTITISECKPSYVKGVSESQRGVVITNDQFMTGKFGKLIQERNDPVRVFKNQYDYTVVIGDDVFEMDERATMPNGVNMYLGTTSDYDPDALGDEIPLASVPQGVQRGIQQRQTMEY